MDLHTDDLAIDGRTRREQEVENFKSIEHECSQLQSDLNAETNARINVDNTERNTRIAQDTKLQNQINDLDKRMNQAESNISNLQTRMATVEEQIKKLNDIIFGDQYINETDRIPIDDSMRQISDEEINDTKVVSDDKSEVILHPSNDEPVVEVN